MKKTLLCFVLVVVLFVAVLALVACELQSYDMSGVTFSDATFTYDGTEKSLEISGTLPDGVSVEYTQNTLRDVGSIKVVALFTGDNEHQSITPLQATLTITPATMEGASFNSKTVTYNGDEHSVIVEGTLPEGTTISYLNNTATEVGEYSATAVITNSNYETLTLQATLTILPSAQTTKIEGFDFQEGNLPTFSATVSNSTQTINLADIVSVGKGYSWGLYSDENGEQQIITKRMALEEGSNTKYIIVWNAEDQSEFSVYAVNVYRLHMYTYSIYNSATGQSERHTVEENTVFSELTADEVEGYTFSSWQVIVDPYNIICIDISFPYTIVSDVYFVANYQAKVYTVTYMVDGEILDTQHVGYNDYFTLLNSAGLEGYSMGWTSNFDNIFCANDNIQFCWKDDVIFTAVKSSLADFEFEVINDGVTVKKYLGSQSTVVIPQKVVINNCEYEVDSIGWRAFADCSSLARIAISSSVTSIVNGAFNGCSGLKSITIPSSVTSIGITTFYDFIIVGGAFCGCSGLESITVDSRNKVYYSEGNCIIAKASNTLVLGCKNSIIPSNVTSIGNDAFNGCSGLTSITIPSSVTCIGEDAFDGCSSLTSITIPSSVTSIGSDDFYGCSGLESITVDSRNTVYRSEGNCLIEKASNTLVLGCKNSIIPSSVTSIDDHAFVGCSGLISITIPSSVTIIGNYAFSGCTGLTSITIPSSVTIIGNYAFYGCNSLTIYCQATSQPSGWASDWNNSDRPVVWGYKE